MLSLTKCRLNNYDCFAGNSHFFYLNNECWYTLSILRFVTICLGLPMIFSVMFFFNPLYPPPFNNPFFLQEYWSVSREQSSRVVLISRENILNVSYQQWPRQHICNMCFILIRKALHSLTSARVISTFSVRIVLTEWKPMAR